MKTKFFANLSIFLTIALFLLNSCSVLEYRKADVKDYPINDADKRSKNMKDGRKITFGKDKKNTGKFDFASSNEMWRAAIDILDFVPWYSDNQKKNESIKISIQFLSNEIRSDALEVKIYNKKCSDVQNCITSKVSSELNSEIKLAILKKAAFLKKNKSDNQSSTW